MKLVETAQERNAAFALRLRVFVDEQGVPADEELDGQDESATHAVALLGGDIVGTGRVLYLDSAEARIGRMAVDRPWRRKGIGSRILETLEQAARRRGIGEATLHAQTYVIAFYSSLGYVEEGWVFLEAGIEHVQMRKRL